MFNRKIVIIGDGAVGSTIAYTLMMKDYVNEIDIIDLNKDKTEGDVLDMVHGISFVSNKIIKVGSYDDVKNANLVIITAGVGQKPGETRLDLLKRNIKVFSSILQQIKPNLNDKTIILVVTNPVDVLSYYTYKTLGISENRVIGSGTVLDSARLRFLISKLENIDAKNVHAYVIGEHGDSEVSAFTSANIGQIPLIQYLNENHVGQAKQILEDLHNGVKNAAYEIISKKGATFYAIGLATAKIVGTILNDERSILTVSTLIKHKFDGKIDDVYLSLPCVVGSSGVKKILDVDYSSDEVLKLIDSANQLKKTYKDLNI